VLDRIIDALVRLLLFFLLLLLSGVLLLIVAKGYVLTKIGGKSEERTK